MKVMISQPMRGKTNEKIRAEREEVIKKICNDGYDVIDTVINKDAPKNIDEAIFYLSKSIEFIGKADAIVFMPGWERARGCRIEYLVAREYGKFIKEL